MLFKKSNSTSSSSTWFRLSSILGSSFLIWDKVWPPLINLKKYALYIREVCDYIFLYKYTKIKDFAYLFWMVRVIVWGNDAEEALAVAPTATTLEEELVPTEFELTAELFPWDQVTLNKRSWKVRPLVTATSASFLVE